MPHPVTTTTWPTGDDLRAWLKANNAIAAADLPLVDEVLLDASAAIYERIDPNKLPADEDDCPRTIARAIVLEGARLLFRRQSPHGMAAFGELALRLRTADVDVENLIQPYGLDPEP